MSTSLGTCIISVVETCRLYTQALHSVVLVRCIPTGHAPWALMFLHPYWYRQHRRHWRVEGHPSLLLSTQHQDGIGFRITGMSLLAQTVDRYIGFVHALSHLATKNILP